MKNALLFLLLVIVVGCNSENHPNVKPKTVLKQKKKIVPEAKKNSIPERVDQSDTVFYSNKFYSNLSNNFNFRLKISEHVEMVDCFNGELKLEILSKNDSLLQTIRTKAGSCAYPFTDAQVSHVRSFETHYNEKKELADGYYHGELIVGDFNFDSLIDIALIHSYPMSGTPSYTFYLQTLTGIFEKSTFYTGKVQFIPVQRNYVKRTFLAKSHTGCCTSYFDYYRVDSLGKCSKTYSKVIEPKE